jgi:uncharacterized protein (DUF2267 family)
MSNTGLEIFDTTLQETHRWLKIMMEALATEDRHVAFAALRAGLHALRDRIGPVNAVHLGAQLPMLLRGAYYEGWRPGAEASRERHVEEFLNHVGANLPRNSAVGAEAAARATFSAIAGCLDTGEVQKVLKLLPREMGQLWPERWEDYRAARVNQSAS